MRAAHNSVSGVIKRRWDTCTLRGRRTRARETTEPGRLPRRGVAAAGSYGTTGLRLRGRDSLARRAAVTEVIYTIGPESSTVRLTFRHPRCRGAPVCHCLPVEVGRCGRVCSKTHEAGAYRHAPARVVWL